MTPSVARFSNYKEAVEQLRRQCADGYWPVVNRKRLTICIKETINRNACLGHTLSEKYCLKMFTAASCKPIRIFPG